MPNNHFSTTPNSNKSTKILINTNTLNAVAKNKKESDSLHIYCKQLDRKLADSFYSIEKESYQCRLIISDLERDLKDKKLRTERTKNNYFSLIRSTKFDETNSFLPGLLKNLDDQESLASRSFIDMIDYKLGSSKTLKSDFETLQTTSIESFEEPSRQILNTYVIKPRCSTGHYARKRPLLSTRCKSSNPIQASNVDRFESQSVSSFKSVRRDRQDVHLANSLYDSKVKLLKIFRNNNSQALSVFSSSSKQFF